MLRIKGQEVRMVLVAPDGSEDSVTEAVKSVSVTFDQEILQEKYLGQVTDQFDDIFNGLKGEMEWDMTSPASLIALDKIRARSQRREIPAVAKFNMSLFLTYPTGRRAQIIAQDIYFGDIDFLSFGARDEYGSQKLSWACSNFRVIAI